MNCCVFVGNLTRDPELLHVTGKNTALAKVGLAVNDRRKDQRGASFFDLVFWGRQAEIVSEFCRKGSRVAVSAQARQEKWQTPGGEKRSKVVFHVQELTLLGSRDNDAADNPPHPVQQDDATGASIDENDIPF